MQYWAAGRSLGLTEDEFYRSTLAKLVALSKAQSPEPEDDEECNDCTPSTTKAPIWLKKNWDADRGAMGDWRTLRGNMKAATEKRKQRQEQRVRLNGR